VQGTKQSVELRERLNKMETKEDEETSSWCLFFLFLKKKRKNTCFGNNFHNSIDFG